MLDIHKIFPAVRRFQQVEVTKGELLEGFGDQETTGDVAEILEKEYGVMEVFFEAKKDKIIGAVNDSLADQIEALSQGAPLPFGGDIYLPEVESLFRDFVTTREIESITGQTEAARLGISHRFKNAQNKTVSPQDVVAVLLDIHEVFPAVRRFQQVEVAKGELLEGFGYQETRISPFVSRIS